MLDSLTLTFGTAYCTPPQSYYMPRFIHPLLLLFVLTVTVSVSEAAHASDQLVRIGVLAYRGKERALKDWTATAQYLTRQIAGYEFVVVPLTNDDIGRAIENREIAFVLTNPGSYVELASAYNITRIATLNRKTPDGDSKRFGAVIFTRADREDIRSLADLKGKSFMAVHKNAFGGWWMAWRELKHKNINPYSDFRELVFSGFPQDKIVYAVRDGIVDAGTVRTGLLENMELEGKVQLRDFRILNAQQVDGFPSALSTELYPDWAFAVLPHTPDELGQNVVIALLQMKPGNAAAIAGGYAEWSIPLDYHSVQELMIDLRVGRYSHYGEVAYIDLLTQYWAWLTGIAVMLLMLAIAYIYSLRINRELNHIKTHLEAANRELEAFSYSVSHDLRSPLRSIDGFSLALLQDYGHILEDEGKVYLERVRANTQRMGDLIDAMLQLSRVTRVEMHVETMNLSRLSTEIAEGLAESEPDHPVNFIAQKGIRVQGDPRLLRVAMENLLANAWKYSSKVAHPQVEFGMRQIAGKPAYFVRDNGAGFDMAYVGKLFGTFQRLHAEADFPGTGIGLATVKRIIQRHGGRVWAEGSPGVGSTFYFTLT